MVFFDVEPSTPFDMAQDKPLRFNAEQSRGIENFDELAIASELAIEESLAGLDVEEQLSQGLIDLDDLIPDEPIAADYTLDFDEVNTGEEIEF